MKVAETSWSEANQRCLVARLARVRRRLEDYIERQGIRSRAVEVEDCSSAEQPEELEEPTEPVNAPSTLATLCAVLRLSAFERDLLLLCAGPDLEAKFAALIAQAHNDTRRTAATFSLGLAALPEAHWSALSPTAPLRRWRLIELGSGESLTTCPLRIDEWTLHFLAGTPHLDERLQTMVRPVQTEVALPAAHRGIMEEIIQKWQPGQSGPLPLIELSGSAMEDQLSIAGGVAVTLGCHLYRIRGSDVPGSASERESFAKLWEREAWLRGSVLAVDFHEIEQPENTRNALSLCESMQAALICLSREPLRMTGRPGIQFEVSAPSAVEQHDLWRASLGPLAARLNGQLEHVVSQFSFGAGQINRAALALRCLSASETRGPSDERDLTQESGSTLWGLCRAQSSRRLEALAQRIDQRSTWEDLVLPEEPLNILRDIARHARQRFRVYETWGFAAKGNRGLGISALFSGGSGTGKTLAAEVLANELRLDLFRIDLSAVVSKYIGETEKNLRRVFDAAEAGGVILLFDEADALFGKRSEVKDSHDRYANIEVSYLLQRMESYRGLAILTSNFKQSLDTAFMRRLRFVVQFPFPDVVQRAQIWRRIFPSATPVEGIDPEKLARLNVAGGNIRNIALQAAFLAADAGEPVRMKHLLQAARRECARLERAPSESELGGWV